MNLGYTIITDISEVDFDDLFERSKDAVDASWPAASTMTEEERKAGYIACITSGLNNEWPGLNDHGPNDRYVVMKITDLDTGIDMSCTAGFVLEGGIFDGRHTVTAPNSSGSRNWLYSDQFRQVRNAFHADIGVTKAIYRNIVADSLHYRHILMRSGIHFEIVEDIESPALGSGFRNVTVEYK
jgi:hypothetical protein